MPYERKCRVTIVYFSCGHTAEFHTSAPKVGEMTICWNCTRLTMVDRVEKGVKRLYRPNINPWLENS
jgi:hypothetical protein